jgi:hypothetical protein
MKHALPLTLSIGLFFFCACTMFEAKQPTPPQEGPKKALAVPVGKNWQIIEEAPKLSNERNERLPFQTEQSVQPEGAKPVSPAEQRKIETPR